ncbi:hypothetical protein HY412_00280 [Candidatus Kaiserbacteria bacterium]|nr:hypothetical protein [Candidatus Kaiserbacteria bacterium]
MQASNKKRLDEIETREGPLPEVHRQLQDKLIPGARRGDVTEWYRRIPGTPKTLRYEAFLSLFVAHSVLFEDYHGGESGQALYGFTQLVVEPAWQRLADIFGEKPLIVKMSWRPEFAWYPADESWPKHGIVPENLLRYR